MYIQRDLHARLKPFLNNREAIVITGIRRVGKTSLLKQLYKEIKSDNKILLDLENPKDQLIFDEIDYNKIPLNLKLNLSKRAFVFIDEIQGMKNTPSIVKYLSDHYDIKFFLTGSASFYIHNMFTESLAGRKYIFELFPFNFNEFLRAKNESPLKLGKKETVGKFHFVKYSDLFAEYLKYGGFPGVVLSPAPKEKEEKLKDIFSAYWSLEIEKLSDFRRKDKMRDLIFLLMERVGSKIDINKLSKELGITRNTTIDYLAFLRDTYLISTIPPYSTNRDVEIRGAKKMYFIDTGLLNQFSRLDRGSVFENAIFNLLRHHGETRYWQQKDGQEIDFIINKKTAYEVKLNASEQDIKKLVRRANKIKIKKQFIVSQKYFKHPQATYGFML